MVDQDRIIKINIEEEMKSAYLDYSLSVIVSRALPDVRDGFKPVHRRILFGMMGLGNTSDKPYKKSATASVVKERMAAYVDHLGAENPLVELNDLSLNRHVSNR